MRLDLAQYRELAAFAQFGSDLDKATQAQLLRGEKMVEVLKQGQYLPMPVEDQVMVIFAGVEGYLDDVDTDAIASFEQQFLPFVKERYPDMVTTLAKTKSLSDELEKKLKEAIKEFKVSFKAGSTGTQA